MTEKVVLVTKENFSKDHTEPAIMHPNVKPWHRFFARVTDLYFITYVVSMFIPFFYYDEFAHFTILQNMLFETGMLVVAIFIESILLATVGTTLGKWIFNVSIRDSEGKKLRFGKAFVRGLKIIFYGMGLQLPLAAVLCPLNAYSKLRSKGYTSWDRGVNVVQHPDAVFTKKLLIVVVAILCIVFQIYSRLEWFRGM